MKCARSARKFENLGFKLNKLESYGAIRNYDLVISFGGNPLSWPVVRPIYMYHVRSQKLGFFKKNGSEFHRVFFCVCRREMTVQHRFQLHVIYHAYIFFPKWRQFSFKKVELQHCPRPHHPTLTRPTYSTPRPRGPGPTLPPFFFSKSWSAKDVK